MRTPRGRTTAIAPSAATALATAVCLMLTPATAGAVTSGGPAVVDRGLVPARAVSRGHRPGGIVVNSHGRPLGHLPIIVEGHPNRGGRVFRVTTGRHGRFHLPPAAAAMGATRWTAQAKFRWYGGVWLRDLNTLRNGVRHLRFRADVVSRGRDSLADGVFVRVSDLAGCRSLNPVDPSHVVTDPDTRQLTLFLVPAHRLVDGTRTEGGTVTFGKLNLCGPGGGKQIVVPAGSWKIAGLTDLGRQLVFSKHRRRGPYRGLVTVFNHPMPQGDPIQYLDVRFAPD
jgi:hypothetical protein